MNANFLKKYVWMLLAICLPMGFVGCSDSDDPVKEETTQVYQDVKPYANFFAASVLNDVYLWSEEIRTALNTWGINEEPIAKVEKVRYKDLAGNDIDKWTMMTDDYASMVGGSDGVSSGTYGCNYKLYLKAQGSEEVVAFVTYTYKDSPAEQAGLKRGDVVLQINGKPMTLNNYTDLYYSSSIQLGVGRLSNYGYTAVEKTVSMNAKAMYEDPILIEKVFDCGGKKVGYLMYTSFTFESSVGLVDVCKRFKQAGVTELILDLRYNGGGYVFTENALASMLAPENEVKNGSVFATEVWNKTYMEYYRKNKVDLNTYFTTTYKATHSGKSYNFSTADANIGLTKIYALVASGSASASESILVGLMPYMDIEIIGEQTHGKYCTGIMLNAVDWYQDNVDALKKNNLDFYKEYPQFADWKKYIDNWGIYVMISRYGDKDGNNACMPDGLVPSLDNNVVDRFEEDYPLGDDRETMLRFALQKAGKTDLTPLDESKSRSAFAQPQHEIKLKSNNPLDGKRIYTGDLIKPSILPIK